LEGLVRAAAHLANISAMTVLANSFVWIAKINCSKAVSTFKYHTEELERNTYE